MANETSEGQPQVAKRRAKKPEASPVFIAGISRTAAKIIAEELANILLDETEEAPEADTPADVAQGNSDLAEVKKLLKDLASKVTKQGTQQQVPPNTDMNAPKKSRFAGLFDQVR